MEFRPYRDFKPYRDRGKGRPADYDYNGDDMLNAITDGAMKGLTKTQIRDSLHIKKSTWDKNQVKYPAMMEAYKLGRALGTERAAEVVAKFIEQGDLSAAKYYLDKKGGWNQTHSVEISGKEGRPIAVETRYTDIDEMMKTRYREIFNKDKEVEDEHRDEPK